MSEKKAKEVNINVDPALKQNCQCAITVVETYVTDDGTSFYVIKNQRGEVCRLANTPEDIASFFAALANAATNGNKD